MIISVSRRTDIPAFYSDWFYNRVKEGFALVRNPWYTDAHKVSKVLINPETCDCIVFWTKNPAPMLARLDEIKDFPYYFHFSVNPYSQKIECNIPKKHQMIDVFKQLSDKIGSQRVVWRYHPMLITNEINANYHIKYFEWIAKKLAGYTSICKIGFVSEFKKNIKSMKQSSARKLTHNEALLLAKTFVEIGKNYDIEVEGCYDKYNLTGTGVRPGQCISKPIIEKILGHTLNLKPNNYRKDEKRCHCLAAIDIGQYNTCPHNCIYCYANHSYNEVQKNKAKHIPSSPILIGNITKEDIINERKCTPLMQETSLYK